MLQTKLYPSEVPQKLELALISDSLKEYGLNVGDIVYTLKGAGANVRDTDYVFSKFSAIFCIERDGVLKVIKGKNLILEDDKEEFVMWNNLMLPEKYRVKYIFGTYLDGDYPEMIGEKVAVIHSFNTRLEINGINYAVVNKNNLIFKK